jgi:hypothetical protein
MIDSCSSLEASISHLLILYSESLLGCAYEERAWCGADCSAQMQQERHTERRLPNLSNRACIRPNSLKAALRSLQVARMASSLYHYDDLSSGASFRLFRIQNSQSCPTGGSSKVEICLFEASFHDHTEYEAVSYAWGRDAASSTIRCNGKDLGVTPNVEAILRMLSTRTDSTGVFWIDSICINQASIFEKNTQVPRMSSIYSEARLVWVWLGEASHEVETALVFFRKGGYSYRIHS